MFDSLAHYGLTQSILQILIIAGVILVVIGMFWHYILAGSLVLFAFVVFFYESPGTHPDAPIASVKSVPPVETEKQRWHRQFMEDCTTVAENSKETCDNIWNDRIMEETRVQEESEPEVQAVKFKTHKKVRYD